MTTIHAPAASYSGVSDFGPVRLTFKDGVADHDGDLSDGLRAYLESNGYGIGSRAKATAPEPDPEPADPRDFDTPELVGTALRDAAVDPRPEDFLAPTNAGDANPHGPDVVSPGVHALQDVRPVKGGDVHVGDPAAQDNAETGHTEDVQSNGTLFDPAAHTVKDVLAYLDTADDTERARVIAAEHDRGTAARKGITGT